MDAAPARATPRPSFFRRPRIVWRRLSRRYIRVGLVRWLVLGIVAGLGSGLLAIAFHAGLEGLTHLLQVHLAGLSLPQPSGESLGGGLPGPYRPWLIPIFTTAVGLITGLLVSRFIPEALEGVTDGTDAMIRAFHQQGGVIRPAVPALKGATAIMTIAAGGSAGQEGPISQLGAGLGSLVAQKLHLTARQRRILLLAGAAGGLGAIFRAPLGGAITAVEVLYSEDFEAEALLPAVVSSVVAYTLFAFVFGGKAILAAPGYVFTNALELPFYLVLAVVVSLAARLFIRTFFTFKFELFGRLKKRFGPTLPMVLGGLCVGLLSWRYPQLCGGGYGWLELAANGRLDMLFLVGLFCGKLLAVSLTIGSGLSGGMFAPALFLGGTAGSIIGQAGHMVRPDIVTQPGGYTLVGMATFFAGVAHAPIGPLIMVCEISQGYGLLAPLMLCSAVALVLCDDIHLYENQVDNKFASPAHTADATNNILESVPVASVFTPGRPTILEESVTLKALADVIAGTSAFVFPVKNHDGSLTGILAVQDVRRVLFEASLHELVLVRDLMRAPVVIHPDMSLYDALMLFVETDLGQLPVVDAQQPDTVLGLLDRRHVFTAYSSTLKALKNEE
ncbi:CBS domain-containing protein [Desulfovibrio aerotolerans]|uniref:CBS domain-containing protein n=1 Tax=Solidesulfovibrio aerotolerans TaxID=295255 RepID=A0A7C9IKI3_9BACT|nr:chloride channel protein [Solidesulfovibrio aerotolerans]MYL82464.1 CBS domain-containing protein [Solidesulfovibrio aerotolerans]